MIISTLNFILYNVYSSSFLQYNLFEVYIWFYHINTPSVVEICL